MQNRTWMKFFGASIPYIAVFAGLYIFRNAFAAVGMYYCGILIILCFERQARLLKIFTSGWNSIWTGTAILLGGFSGVIVFWMWDFAKAGGVNLIEVFAEYGLGGNGVYVFVFIAIVLNPFLEELFWRGYLIDEKKGPSWVDAAFAGYHVPALFLVIKPLMAMPAFFLLCGAGWGFRLLRNKLGGLMVPYLGHLAADISIIVGIYFLIR